MQGLCCLDICSGILLISLSRVGGHCFVQRLKLFLVLDDRLCVDLHSWDLDVNSSPFPRTFGCNSSVHYFWGLGNALISKKSKQVKTNNTFNWVLFKVLLVLLHRSHTAGVNQFTKSLQVCYGFVNQLRVSGDGLQPGYNKTTWLQCLSGNCSYLTNRMM